MVKILGCCKRFDRYLDGKASQKTVQLAIASTSIAQKENIGIHSRQFHILRILIDDPYLVQKREYTRIRFILIHPIFRCLMLGEERSSRSAKPETCRETRASATMAHACFAPPLCSAWSPRRARTACMTADPAAPSGVNINRYKSQRAILSTERTDLLPEEVNSLLCRAGREVRSAPFGVRLVHILTLPARKGSR